MLLAIDTSAGTSVAIVDGGEIRAEVDVRDTRRHAEVIGSLILESLDDAAAAVRDLTGVAIGMGPGPFTGLRVGIAAANAFALGADIPVHRVVSHDALAFAQYLGGTTGRILVTTDARRRERYWSAYQGEDGFTLPERIGEPSLHRPEALEHEVAEYASFRRIDADWVSAASVGLLAERLGEHGRAFAAPEPLYLRSPDVTLASGSKRVSA